MGNILINGEKRLSLEFDTQNGLGVGSFWYLEGAHKKVEVRLFTERVCSDRTKGGGF